MNGINNIRTTGDCSDPNRSDEKMDVLKFAIQEVEIGTPDSITLAVNMLKRENIEIPSLNLLRLHEDTHGTVRNAEFAKRSQQLQRQVIQDIKEMLQ